jgi:hypothetical protein
VDSSGAALSRCIEAPKNRLKAAAVPPLFRSFGARSWLVPYPGLALWATFWHYFAVSDGCNLLSAWKLHVSRR